MWLEFSEFQIHAVEPLLAELTVIKAMCIIPSFKCETLCEVHGSAGCALGLHESVY